MNVFEELGVFFEKFDPKAKEVAVEVIKYTTEIEIALNTGVAIDLENLIPQSAALRTEVMNLCQIAIKACNAIIAFDTAGVSGRLLRLGTDWTMIVHGKHDFAYYSILFQKMFKDITGK